MMPESYVVRIYRRDRSRPDHIEGVLIAAEELDAQPFHSGAELLRLLMPATAGPEASRRAQQE